MNYRTREVKEKILELVRLMQPVTAEALSKALKEDFRVEMSEDETRVHLENLRSGYPVKIAHAGPDRYIVVDLR